MFHQDTGSQPAIRSKAGRLDIAQLARPAEFPSIVYASRAREDLGAKIKHARNSSAPALTTGETGVGKELIARAVHTVSARREREFIPFDCGAVNSGLVESELFGHRRGSFTGADRDFKGVVRTAEGSTQRQVPSARPRKAYTNLALLLILLAGSGMFAMAQTSSRPDRGINPIGSYAVSDIESVNLINGNMSLAIPLAALPPMAGGELSRALRAHFNSKLWNTKLREVEDPGGNYVEETLQLSNEGGWRISTPYVLWFRHRDADYQAIVPTLDDPSDPLNQELRRYTYKMVLTTPDGASHELRPVDYPSSPGFFDFTRGYYKDSPQTTSINASMRYYSFDGSHLWARIDPFGTNPTSWSVYMPDGTVIELSNGIQRIKDTNGNKIKIWTDIAGSVSTTHYQDELTGREIKYIYNSSTNTGQTQYQTVGGSWVTIDINWGTTHVFGRGYSDGSPCGVEQLLEAWIPVVRSIVLPQTEAGQARKQFTFSYNSDTTDNVNFQRKANCLPPVYQTITSASHGWGALSQMVTPPGATVDYTYNLDEVYQLVLGPSDAPRESLKSKSVMHDGTTDTWSYVNSSTSGGVTNPDGSYTTETFYPHDPALASIFGGGRWTRRTCLPDQPIE